RRAMTAVSRIDPRVLWWQIAVIFAVTVIAYLSSLQNELIWDDLHLIVNNPSIKDWRHVGRLLVSDLYPQGVLSHYYRPLQALTYVLDYRLWGLAPMGFHLTNIFLHAACAVLLFLLVSRVLSDVVAGFIAGLLFA